MKINEKVKKSIDLICLDLRLPRFDLLHRLEEIKQARRGNLPFIILLSPRGEMSPKTFKNIRIVKNIKKLLVAGRNRFSSVTLSKDKSRFECIFENGESFTFSRKFILDEDPKAAVKKIEIPEHRTHFEVILATGRKYEIPWSFVRHHCDPNYEFFKYKRKSIAAEKRDLKIGDKIKNWRVKQGMTQKQLAKATSIKRANISRLESNKHAPHLDTLEKIADALHVAVAELIS